MTGSVPAAINSGAEEIPVKFTIELPVKLTKGEKWHVASCPILDVHSQGDTVEEAKSNLTEALTLFFLSCFERGTLDEVLRECGFKPNHGGIRQDKITNTDEYLHVPIPLIAAANR